MVEDPLFSVVAEVIRSEKISAEYAIEKTIDKLKVTFGKQRFSTRLVADLAPPERLTQHIF
jgi:hypothetical protein